MPTLRPKSTPLLPLSSRNRKEELRPSGVTSAFSTASKFTTLLRGPFFTRAIMLTPSARFRMFHDMESITTDSVFSLFMCPWPFTPSSGLVTRSNAISFMVAPSMERSMLASGLLSPQSRCMSTLGSSAFSPAMSSTRSSLWRAISCMKALVFLIRESCPSSEWNWSHRLPALVRASMLCSLVLTSRLRSRG